MYQAVRQVLLANLYSHGVVKGKEHNPLINGAYNLVSLAMENPIPDEQLGAHIRGMWAGVNIMKNGFDALDSIKSAPAEEKKADVNLAE